MPYLEDASGFRGHADRVIVAENEAAVLEVLWEASARQTPVTVAGAGTGVTGARVAQGGWVLSLEKLNRLEIRDGRATVGPGALLRDLHAAAASHGQFFGPDPTETAASLGGAIATNASGSRSFRYGDTRRHVLRLRVALSGGRTVEVRRGEPIDFEVPAIPLPRTTKNTAGYPLKPGMDWVDLFSGSEGTLGVVTEAELRLLPAPAALLTGVIFFLGDASALDAVDDWRSVSGLRMLEYLDRFSLELLRTRFPEIPVDAGAALLIEQELEGGDSPDVDRWLHRLEAASGLDSSWFASGARDRERFRLFRHALPEAVNDLVRRNGYLKMGSDFAVPLERNREMLATYRQELEREFSGRYVIFGHIGDAHVHANILPSSGEEFNRAGKVMVELARKAVSLGGTVSAEHGLGKRKAHLLELQYSAERIEAMKDVKRRLDPQWLLGRGTLFPFPVS